MKTGEYPEPVTVSGCHGDQVKFKISISKKFLISPPSKNGLQTKFLHPLVSYGHIYEAYVHFKSWKPFFMIEAPFHQLWKIWNNRTIKTPTKIRIYRASVISILLYGAEVWNTTKKQMKRFEVFHQISLRRILKIKWFYHVSNEEVLRRANIKSIETFIGAARLRWYGHVVRMPNDRLQNFLLNWRPNYGKRSRGRPR